MTWVASVSLHFFSMLVCVVNGLLYRGQQHVFTVNIYGSWWIFISDQDPTVNIQRPFMAHNQATE